MNQQTKYMNPKKKWKLSIVCCQLSVLFCLLSISAFAQKDTTKKVDIMSTFRPVLRKPTKIALTPAQLEADSGRQKLEYNIPSENLFYNYQAIPIQPVSLTQDSTIDLGTRNYLKGGFGNFSTAYINGGFSFGDGKKQLLNVYTDYLTQKGKIQFQNYRKLALKANGSYFLPKNEAYGSASIMMMDNYLYGYDHSVFNYKGSNDSIRNHFQEVSLKAGYRNTVATEYGISYDPNVEIKTFASKNKLSESSLIVTAPIKKEFGDAFAINIEGKADITTYTSKNLSSNVKFSNNIFSLSPSLSYASSKFTITGGITPTWNNGKFVWLPNVFGEAPIRIKDKEVVFQAGWVGRYVKNTFGNMIQTNPFLETVSSQTNTKEVEFYAGLKSSVGKHFNVSGKAAFVAISNMPFYINDPLNEKAFIVSNESHVNDLRVHGDLSYINQDKLTVTAGLTFNGYTGMRDNAKAWGTTPMELNASLRWWAFKQVMLKGDFYAFAGGNYYDKGSARPFSGGNDFSAGAEFRISKRFSAWLDVNNIFNNKYERWHNYPVYGLGFIGGVKVNF